MTSFERILKMHKLSILLFSVALMLAAGCSGPSGMLLSVDFPKEKSLTYKFVTNRSVILKLEGDVDGKSSGKEQKTVEGFEMVVSYTPQETDVYGNTTIMAECKDIKVNRKTFTNRSDAKSDPVSSLKGKNWTFVINSAGSIQDYSSLEAVTKELGVKAINESGTRRIKSPDLIWDFVATQWFIWDALSSNKKLYAGVNPGQSWSSILSVPFAVRVPIERTVEYSIDPEHPTEGSEITIDSSYGYRGYERKGDKLIFKSAITTMPKPYEGSFQTKGMFGFLRDYKAENLSGSGVAKYNIETGILISDHQEYNLNMTAGFMFPLGKTSPQLNVTQTIDVELIDE